MDYARNEFELMVLQGDGLPLRDHLASAARSTGQPEPRLHRELPEAWAHVWAWFTALSNRRVRPQPITFEAISAWRTLTGAAPTPREVAAIVALDDLFRKTLWGTE